MKSKDYINTCAKESLETAKQIISRVQNYKADFDKDDLKKANAFIDKAIRDIDSKIEIDLSAIDINNV